MTTDQIRAAIAIALLAGILSGCAAPARTLYYWGEYQPVVYAHFKGEAAQLQQDKLQQMSHQAQSLGQPVPPGFNAHLGLLHLNLGQLDEARRAFATEAALFPESQPYMNFLLGRFAATTAGTTP